MVMMTGAEKLEMLKTMMLVEDDTQDSVIMAYLRAAEQEIISWRWGASETKPTTLPEELEMTQIFAVINGYSQIGAEGQTTHREGAIERIYSYDTMINWIHANVTPLVRCI